MPSLFPKYFGPMEKPKKPHDPYPRLEG